MEQKAKGCPGLVRSAMLSIDIVREKHRLNLFGLVMAIEKFSEASRQEGNELADFIRGDGSKALANAQKFKQTHYAGRTDLGWRLQKKGLQVPCKFFQLIISTRNLLAFTLQI